MFVHKVRTWGKLGVITFLVGEMKYFQCKRRDQKPREYSNHCYFSVEHFKLSAKGKNRKTKLFCLK